MTPRPLRGVDMLNEAARRPQPAAIPTIPYIIYDGLPRTGLSVREVAKISGHKIDRIHRAVRDGEIRADRTGQAAVIPISELAVIEKWADYEHGP